MTSTIHFFRKTITYLFDMQKSTATEWLNAKRGYKKSVIKEANIRILKLEIIFVGLPSPILEIVCRFFIKNINLLLLCLLLLYLLLLLFVLSNIKRKLRTRDFEYLPGNSLFASRYFRMADPAHSALAGGSLPSVALAIPWRPVAQIG